MKWVKITYRFPALLIEEVAESRKIVGKKLRLFFETAIDRLPQDDAELAKVIQRRPGKHARTWGTRMKEISVSLDPKYPILLEALSKRMGVSSADVVRAALGDYVQDLPGRATSLKRFSAELVWLGEIPGWIRAARKSKKQPLKLVSEAPVRLVDHGVLYLSVVRPLWEYGPSPFPQNAPSFLPS